MCGLIGGTGKIESRYLVSLGCLSESRGSDSAGVAWQVADHLRMAKVAKNPLVAFPVDLAPALRHAAKYRAPVIGHTRQATQGAVTSRNAHPFIDKDAQIAWAHNGIIYNDKDFGTFEVDSECLIGGIVKRDFSAYRGAIALLWIEKGKLHAFRKNNPLFRGVKKGAVYLASEEAMLEAIGCHRIKALSEGFVYVWNGNNLEGTSKVQTQSYTTTATKWEEGEFSHYGEYGYCAGRGTANFKDGHNFFHAGAWHTHSVKISYASACNGCERAVTTIAEPVSRGPLGRLLLPAEKGSAEEVAAEAEEVAEAERMLGTREACQKCRAAPRGQSSVWCEDCLAHWRGH